MKLLAGWLLFVGIIWLVWVALMYLTLSGMSEPVSILYTSVYYAALLLGPLLLIAGALLSLASTHQQLGAILILVSCAVLTITEGRDVILSFHVEPLQAKPAYALLALTAAVILLADVAAYRVVRVTLFKTAGASHSDSARSRTE